MTEPSTTTITSGTVTHDRSDIVTRRDELGLGSWDLLVLAGTVAVAVVTPLEVVFGPLDNPGVIALSVLVSLVFAADIRRRLADRETPRRRYLRTWLAVDVLAAIPFDVIAVLPGVGGSAAEPVVRFLGLLRLLRVARILVLQREWRLRTSFNPAVLRLSFFVFWVALLAHWIACGWIALDGFEAGHPELHPYHQALYWTITTITTVGYGDITPQGSAQVSYTMVVMGLGAAMYGYIIGNVASLLANIDVLRSRHLGRIESVNHFMRDRRVPRRLQAQVRDYYNYLWESRMGDQAEMLEDLPTPLRVEIALHLNRAILEKVPLFEAADESFLRELAVCLEPMVGIPGETIVRRGEIGRRLFFINRGAVEVLGYDEETVVATLSDGDFFGEMALLADQPRANTVRAIAYCNLYALDRADFDRVLEDHPEFAAEVRRIAERRRAESDRA